jgi:membrane-associated phospholipid phosphatase
VRNHQRTVSVVLVVMSLVGLLGTVWYFVRTAGGQGFDSRSLRGQDLQRPGLILASDDIARVGLALGALVVATAAAFALVRRQFRHAIGAVVVVGGSLLTTQLLKAVIVRPALVVITLDDRRGNSFPSGHSTFAFGLTAALILLAPTRLRGAAATIGAAFAATIATATVFARWHRPSDVIGAAFVVAAWTFMTIALFGRSGHEASRPRFPFLTFGMLTLVGGSFVVAFNAMTSDGLSRRLLIVDAQQGRIATSVGRSFTVATSAIAIAACVLAAVVLAVTEMYAANVTS